jgi:O-antigen ligase
MSTDVPSRTSEPVSLGRNGALGIRASRIPADIVECILLWAFVAALAWCPFLFGSTVLLAWGINAVVFPGLVAIYEASLLIRGEPHPVAVKQIKLPAVLFSAVVLWVLIQNATWTPDWMHHPIWQMTADDLNKPVAGSISVDRDATSLALLRLVTAASAFWMALQLCRTASRANFLLKSIAAVSCAYAAYGLFAFAITPGRVLWIERPLLRSDFVTSTFINPNHFATYAGMGVIVICGLILQLYRDEFTAIAGSVRFRIATFIQVTGQRAAVLLGAGFVVLVALLLTQSRGGFLSTALGLFVVAILSLKTRRQGSPEQRRAVIVLGAFLVAVAFLAFGDVVAGRIAQQGVYDKGRIALYTTTLRSILDSPLLGYGYGTFVDVIPMFRDQSVADATRWGWAHNTYLEAVQGLGILFGSMLVASIVLLVRQCMTAAMTRQKNEWIPCVAAGIAFLVAVDSLVNFSVQLEAIGVTFMALLGAGVAQSQSSRLVLAD